MTTNNELRESGVNPAKADGPTLVQCATYRCMAERDKNGKWRSYFKKDLLPEPVTVIPRWH
jgi:TPP-dependent pyruvate/acetoin dehydrogenase alpha subunit